MTPSLLCAASRPDGPPCRAPSGRVLALGAAFALAAAGAAPAGSPPGAPIGRSPAIPVETVVLANGLKVVVSRDPTAPVVAVAMAFGAGGRSEPRGRAGFAHLFERLMFEGSKHAPKGQFDRILESYGGDNNASTHEDFTIFYEVLPSNALPVALWLDADRLADLDLGKESLRNQVSVVKEERRMRVDNEPYGRLLHVDIASRAFSNWQNSHPVIGSAEDYDAVVLGAAEDFFKAYYAPRNGALAIVGDVDAVQALAWAREYFEWIPNRGEPAPADFAEPEPGPPPGGGPPCPPGATRPCATPSRWAWLADPHARLPAFAAAWGGLPERRTADYYALLLVGQALFDGKSSRLYQELVKRVQVAVSVQGGLGFPLVEDPLEYKAPGSLGGWVVHKAQSTPLRVKDLVMRQVSRIAERGVDAKELARLKTSLRSKWVRSQETCLGRARMLLTSALLDGDPAAVNGELERFMAVTPEDTRRAAARYLRPDNAVLFSVAPGGARPEDRSAVPRSPRGGK
ncbi:MAG: insulinase family protein [Elusimicrobia bacterium]|nr:insulinase family protein [Elusimicrobiota bacterium]